MLHRPQFDAGVYGPVWRVVNKADLLRNMDAAMSTIPPNAAGGDASAKAVSGAAGDASSSVLPVAKPGVAESSGRTDVSPTSIDDADSTAESTAYKSEQGIRSRNENMFILSADSGSGIEGLVEALTDFARVSLAGAEQALVTRSRHRQSLVAAQHFLVEALEHFGQAQGQEELLAEQLRLAATELGRLAGRVSVEDVLDVIFRDFCIGK